MWRGHAAAGRRPVRAVPGRKAAVRRFASFAGRIDHYDQLCLPTSGLRASVEPFSSLLMRNLVTTTILAAANNNPFPDRAL